jgi:hypothetical protein
MKRAVLALPKGGQMVLDLYKPSTWYINAAMRIACTTPGLNILIIADKNDHRRFYYETEWYTSGSCTELIHAPTIPVDIPSFKISKDGRSLRISHIFLSVESMNVGAVIKTCFTNRVYFAEHYAPTYIISVS